jgi:hypothetical protein
MVDANENHQRSTRTRGAGARRHAVRVFRGFPQGSANIHSFCTAHLGFSLDAIRGEAQSVEHSSEMFLVVLPEHCGRTSGSR